MKSIRSLHDCLTLPLTFLAVFCAAAPAIAQTPQTLTTLALLPPATGHGFAGQIAFLSENAIAALSCSGEAGVGSCKLVVVEFTDGKLEAKAESRTSNDGTETNLFAIADGRIILESHGNPHLHLLSPDLRSTEDVPFGVWPRPSRNSSVGVQPSGAGWSLRRLTPPFAVVRTGAGAVEAISEDAVAVRMNDTIRVESINGESLGSIRVKPRTKCSSFVQFAGSGRLYLDECGNHRIIDYSGLTLLRTRGPSGGRWSQDGKRVLRDYATRRVPFLQSAAEVALAIATVGVGVSDQESNMETIRV